MPLEAVRAAHPDDAETIARLSAQLGYACDPADVCKRLTDRSTDATCAVFVAQRERAVVGWIEVGIRRSLDSGSWAEIFGLVVDESARRDGVGASLIEAARAWSAERDQTRLRVRTNVLRDDAAAFYVRRGFHEVKQQRVFDCVHAARPALYSAP